MATSRGFLSGTPHLVGSGAAVLGLTGGFLAGGPALVSVGLGAAAYAAGFLLAPRRRAAVGVDDLAAVRRAVTELQGFCARNSHGLGRELLDLVNQALRLVDEIVTAWSELQTSPTDRHSVESVVADHLPTVLRNHLALPADLRDGDARAQVEVLLAELLRVREQAYAGAVRRVQVQGSFLRDRYDRENPLES